MSENTTTRRTVMAGAAWSIPVVAIAAAAPSASASTEPPATYFYTGGTAGIKSGGVGVYNLNGQDADGNAALLPAGSTITITPGPGVVLEVVGSTSVTLTPSGAGYIATITGADVTAVTIRIRITGPVGESVDYKTHVPGVDPVDDNFPITITSA